jgi:transglutaminase/protease-like cytokinesis protein 3
MKHRGYVKHVAGLLFAVLCVFLAGSVPAGAATLSTDSEIRAAMEQAFQNGDLEVVLTLEKTFSVDASQALQEAENYVDDLYDMLQETALEQNRIMTVKSYSLTLAASQTATRAVTYTFDISPRCTQKVKKLTSEKNAYRQALKALKKRDYTSAFYSEDAMYYDTFVLVLEHHPEYNYGLTIWKSTNGTCGYRPGSLTAAQIKSRMTKADTKADAILEQIIKAGMTKKQKLQAIHNYLVRHCVYDEGVKKNGYDNAYTAYGCLVEKSAVCQGYAAAFNLLATKVGVSSIAVSGSAGGGSHGWNYVKVGNTYRYVDVTWDDPLPDRGSKAKVRQNYFYVTQSTLAADHTWDKTDFAKKYLKYGT